MPYTTPQQTVTATHHISEHHMPHNIQRDHILKPPKQINIARNTPRATHHTTHRPPHGGRRWQLTALCRRARCTLSSAACFIWLLIKFYIDKDEKANWLNRKRSTMLFSLSPLPSILRSRSYELYFSCCTVCITMCTRLRRSHDATRPDKTRGWQWRLSGVYDHHHHDYHQHHHVI
jgi:hypothetical protein